MPPPDGVDLVPVDHDPFNSPDQAAMSPESYANPLVQKFLGGVVGGLATLPQRAIQNSQWSVDTGNYDPGPTLEAATLPMGTGAIAGVPVKAGEAVLGAGPIRAYHGSPFEFDKFDASKIGTGEGAQSYGHGLYFAENEKVAQGYRDALKQWKIDGAPADPLNPSHIASATLEHFGGDKTKAIEDLTQSAKVGPQEERDVASKAIDLLGSGAELPSATSKGHMYQVDINADPEHFLDWEKQLNQQSPQVQDAIKQAMGIDYYGKFDPQKSQKLWDEHKYSNAGTAVRKGHIAFSDEQVADRLGNAGIPGIKYLDQGSRPARSLADTQNSVKYYSDMLQKEPNNQFAADQLKQYQGDLEKYDKGTRNYVVFNDKIVDILRKYGLAGLSALPPALQAAAHQQLTPVDHDPFAANGS